MGEKIMINLNLNKNESKNAYQPTKREYFALNILCAILNDNNSYKGEHLLRNACQIADAFIYQLEKTDKEWNKVETK